MKIRSAPPPSTGGHKPRVDKARRNCLGAAAALVLAAPAGATQPAATIDTITLERGCGGCANESKLVLQRDGRAELVRPGNARIGVAEQRSSGRITPQAFAQLAQQLLAGGFFTLADSYADPQLQDGPWATLTVTRGAQHKQVFRRDEAGPPALMAMEAAVDAARAELRFEPAPGTTPR